MIKSLQTHGKCFREKTLPGSYNRLRNNDLRVVLAFAVIKLPWIMACFGLLLDFDTQPESIADWVDQTIRATATVGIRTVCKPWLIIEEHDEV